MSARDIIRKSILENYSSEEITTTMIVVVLGMTLFLSIYIFLIYRLKTKDVFYSKEFNISLIPLALITAAIILTIQQSLVVSLGMVGALSIVRFRTAIKNPLDLVFLFWSISTGIICGAGLTEAAVIVSVVITIALFASEMIPYSKAPMIATVLYKCDLESDDKIYNIIKKYQRKYSVKARNVDNTSGMVELIVELRIKDHIGLSRELSEVNGVSSVSLLSYDGDMIF